VKHGWDGSPFGLENAKSAKQPHALKNRPYFSMLRPCLDSITQSTSWRGVARDPGVQDAANGDVHLLHPFVVVERGEIEFEFLGHWP
jgi:hypothetical protein